MEKTTHPPHPTPRIRQMFHSLRAVAHLMMRKKRLEKVNANSPTGYFVEFEHKPLVSLFDTQGDYVTILTQSCCQMRLITCTIDYETR